MKYLSIAPAVALCAVLAACGDKAPPPPPSASPPAPAAEAAKPDEVAKPDDKADFSTLSQAIAGTRLEMLETTEAELSPGAVQLTLWSAQRMKWADLQGVPQGKYGLAMKDPDTQRGQRLCVKGASVIEIHAEKTATGGKVYFGGLINDGGNETYRFIAVGSTGELVESSRASFCGVFTGITSYANTGGGTTHAVQLVGMFDLPENR